MDVGSARFNSHDQSPFLGVLEDALQSHEEEFKRRLHANVPTSAACLLLSLYNSHEQYLLAVNFNRFTVSMLLCLHRRRVDHDGNFENKVLPY